MIAAHERTIVRAIEFSDQPDAQELILSGLQEHWGFRDASKNRDLADICRSYADATFLVASEGDRIVGTGALKLRSGVSGVAEVVRMSVAADKRRKGIGRMILRELLGIAESLGVQTVVLEDNRDLARSNPILSGGRLHNHTLRVWRGPLRA